MFRLDADAATSSARFERLNELFINIPNDEISYRSSTIWVAGRTAATS
jgi:hypothetical protein